MKNNNIAIIWDFDGTLTPDDSTSETIKILTKQSSEVFWDNVKRLKRSKGDLVIENILASDAPIWMFALSRIAFSNGVPLNKEFFREFVKNKINLFPDVIKALQKIQDIESLKKFKKQDIKINHFIVSAGLKDLIEQCFPGGLIRSVFGCRYEIGDTESIDEIPESIPVFCMDETMKTRAIFEICKGSFQNDKIKVNKKVEDSKLWCQFENIIYIGDGPTDIPALSLVRSRGGCGIILYDKDKDLSKTKKRLSDLSIDKRTDLIAPADFSLDSELIKFIENRCIQILQKYEASNFSNI